MTEEPKHVVVVGELSESQKRILWGMGDTLIRGEHISNLPNDCVRAMVRQERRKEITAKLFFNDRVEEWVLATNPEGKIITYIKSSVESL